jgi:hypothetical protein
VSGRKPCALTLRLDAAPQRPLGSDQRRIGGHPQRRDAKPLKVRLPGGPIGKAPIGMLGHQPDDRAGQGAGAHIGERLGVDHVIRVPRTQQLEKVAAALRRGRAEPSKAVVADLRAEAVHRLMPRPGVVGRDPGGARQPGAQYLAGFVEKAVLLGRQQPHHLPLGHRQAEVAQLRDQPRHPHLSLMVLRHNKAPQRGAKMPRDARRQRRHPRAPVGGQPPLAAIADHPRPDLQILYYIAFVTLKARTGRHRGGNHLVLDRNPGLVAAAPPALAVGLGRTCRFHAARLARRDPRSPLQPFQPRDLRPLFRDHRALFRDHPLLLCHLAQHTGDQPLQLGQRQIIEIPGQRHRATKPAITPPEKPLSSSPAALLNPRRPDFCPRYELAGPF